MTRWTIATIAVLALGMAASGCSGGKEAQREDETARAPAPAEMTEPKEGLVTSVDSQRLLLDSAEDPGDDEALFERTTRSVVSRGGKEIGWEELSEGDAVRVTWDRGVFGPDRIARVEVLSGPEADEVRQRTEGGMELDEDDINQPMAPRPISPGVGMPGEPTLPPDGGDGSF